MRVVIAECSVDYEGRLTAHLPPATRLLLVKADGSVLVHSDGGSYKPLNWMAPPCSMTEVEPDEHEVAHGVTSVWVIEHARSADRLRIRLHEVLHDTLHELGVDPGLVKDGVEAHLQSLLADHVHALGDGWSLVRREHMTAIGPVDILCRDSAGQSVAVQTGRPGQIDRATPRHPTARHLAVEVKRHAGIDAVEQLTRYLELMNRDPHLRPVRGMIAAQSITRQARTLAEDRGIECKVVDYDELRGLSSVEDRLF